MTHHNLALQRTYRFQRNADYDKHCGTAQAYARHSGTQREDYREYSDYSEEYRADKRYLVERVVDEVRRGLAGSVSRDRSVVLLEVVRYLNRIVGNGNIEIVERNDQHKVNYRVGGAVLAEKSYKAVPEAVLSAVNAEEVAYSLRQAHKRHREDDRHYARHRDLYRNMSGLTAVHFSADYPLCVLDRDPALRVGHQNNEPDHRREDNHDKHHKDDILHILLAHIYKVLYRVGYSRNDTREKYHGDTVAYALFVDTVAQPDDKRGARDKAGNNGDRRQNDRESVARGIENVAVFQHRDMGRALGIYAVPQRKVEGCRLEYRYAQRNKFRYRVDLLSALVALLG